MDAKELRIGNLIYDNGGNIIVILLIHRDYAYIDKSKFDDWCNYNIENGEIQSSVCLEECSPIPLTEEWLLEFGFERRGLYYHFPGHDIFKLDQYKNKNSWWLRYYTEEIDCTRLNYVNQLQNLYFALTGQDLIPK